MKMNYPAAINGGAAQQAYEMRTRNARDGVKRMLAAAKIDVERLSTVFDLGCRAGDTTLGILQVTPEYTHIFAFEEYSDAIILAKLKFASRMCPHKVERGDELGRLLPTGWLNSFRQEVLRVSGRSFFVHCNSISDLPSLYPKADLAVGFQLLHWLDAGENGLPKPEIIRSIREGLKTGGVFLAGTSTAFFDFGKADVIEGTRSRWSIHEHPFMKIVFEEVARLMAVERQVPEPAKPTLSISNLGELLMANGFGDIQFGHFLISYPLNVLITETARNVPLHQGRLNGVPDEAKARIIDCALKLANARCDSLAGDGKADPRLVADRNVWEAVPWLRATAV